MTTSYKPDTLDGKVECDGLGDEACREDAQRHAHTAEVQLTWVGQTHHSVIRRQTWKAIEDQ